MHDAMEQVRQIVVRLSPASLKLEDIGPDDSLVELGMDSLRMIDLAMELETLMDAGEFPIQQWADAELAREGRQFTVGSLAEAFSALAGRGGAGL